MKTDKSKYDKDGNLKNGLFKEYFRDGSIACEGQHRNGNKTGEWKFYFKNGRLQSVGKYDDDVISGSWKWYREK